MKIRRLVFRVHAVERMFERGVTELDVREALESGECIERYPTDAPYPSMLVLGMGSNRPLHVVVAENAEDDETVVITVYEPDPELWEDDYRTRRRMQ